MRILEGSCGTSLQFPETWTEMRARVTLQELPELGGRDDGEPEVTDGQEMCAQWDERETAGDSFVTGCLEDEILISI